MPTAERHVPYGIYQTQFLRFSRASRPFTTHNLQNDGLGFEVAEWKPSCENLKQSSDIRRDFLSFLAGREESQPLSQPCRKQKCPLPV